jgi:hypothetical protein
VRRLPRLSGLLGANRDERGPPSAPFESALAGLLVVSTQPLVKLAGGVLKGRGGSYGLSVVRHADAFSFGIHLDPVGRGGVAFNDHVLEYIANRIVDRLLHLADTGARSVLQLVALHGRVRVLVADVEDVRVFFPERVFQERIVKDRNRWVARAFAYAYDSRT